MSTELAVRSSSHSLALIDGALSIQQILDQRTLVMRVMKEAMVEGHHYGTIPGCGPKPAFLQPGAQALCSVFCLDDSFDIKQVELQSGHREYTVTCTLTAQNGRKWQGVGLCSSMESKYRFRNSAAIVEDTGEPVPKEYWDKKNASGPKAANDWLSTGWDGAKVGVKKVDGEWHIVLYKGGDEGKVENPNIYDSLNTVLKIGVKRAYVAATIFATASNDLFTQDLEDIRENLNAIEGEWSEMNTKPETKPEPSKTEPRREDQREQREERSDSEPSPDDLRDAKPVNQKPSDTLPMETDWKGVAIKGIRTKESGKDAKRAWKAWFIDFSNNQCAGTFSATAGGQCSTAFEANAEMKYDVKVKPGNKAGTWELVEINEEDNIP
jgi:hypothetical protein